MHTSAATASASTTAPGSASAPAATAWSTTIDPALRPAADPGETRLVYVPQAGGALVGIVHAAPWLAEDLQQAMDRTRCGVGPEWPGQPVFRDELTARAWTGWISELAPAAAVDGWTVHPVLVAVEPGAGGLRRVHPVTADGTRTFWRRPTPILLEATRVYLAALTAHLREHVLPQVEHARTVLTGRGVDERTLRHLAQVQQLLTGATDALAGLDRSASRPGWTYR